MFDDRPRRLRQQSFRWLALVAARDEGSERLGVGAMEMVGVVVLVDFVQWEPDFGGLGCRCVSCSLRKRLVGLKGVPR